MKKKGLLRVSAGLAAVILSGATLSACGGNDDSTTNVDVDLSVAKITNKEALLVDWGVNGGGRTITLANSVAKIRIDGFTLEFKSSDETVATIDDAGKVTPLAAGKTTFTVLLNGKVADSIEITFKNAVYQSIETVAKAVLASSGDSTPVYSFKGVVTALIGTKAFTVQEGDFAFYVYKNPADVCSGHALAVGDVVAVTTHAQIYNGLVESKDDTTVTYLADETAETINARTVQNKDLNNDLQSVLVNVSNLLPAGALTRATSSDYGVLNVKDGTADDKTVSIYVNKYLPADVLNAINTKLDKLANDAYTANLKNVVVSIYNDFQYLVTNADQIELVPAAAVNPTKVTVSNKDTMAQMIVGNTAKVSLAFEPDNCNAKGMTYTSTDASVVSVNEEGVVTALKEGTAKITATSSVVTTLSDEIEITVIAPKFVVNPIAGEEYYIAFDCSAGICYLNGEMDGYYGKSVPDKADAQKFVIEKGTGDNEGKFALKGANGKYIDIVVSGTHTNFVYSETAGYFDYDATNFCYYKTIDGTKYYFGTNGTYATASVNKDSPKEFPARIYPTYMFEAPRVGSTVKIGTYHYNLTTPGYLYLNGELDGTYFKTGDADTFTIEEGTVTGTYAIKNSSGKYIAREEQTNDKGTKFFACILADAKSTATDFVWNAGNMTFETTTIDPGKLLGTSGTKTYTTIGYSKKSYSDMCWCHVYLVSQPAEHGESTADPLTVAEAIDIAKTLGQNESSSKMYYIKGKVAKIASAFSASYGNTSVFITDDGVEKTNVLEMFELYNLTGLDGAKLMSANDVEVGDTVTTKCNIKYYYKNATTFAYESAASCPTLAIVKANNAIRGLETTVNCVRVAANDVVTIDAGIVPTTVARDTDAITWTIDDPTKGTLDKNTGAQVKFTAGAVTADTSVTLTASWKENADATSITKSVVVSIEAPTINGARVKFNGSVAPTTSGNDKVEWTVDGAKVTIEKGTGSNAGGDNQAYIGNASNPEMRAYKNQRVVFTPASGKTISYVLLVVSAGDNFIIDTALTNATVTKLVGSGTSSLNNVYLMKLIPTDGTQAVTFVPGGTTRIAAAEIVYAD